MARLWKKPENLSSWRKISVGMWKRPSDPTIYGYETINVENLMEFLDEVSQVSGEKVTLTAFLIKAMSDVIAEHPKLNSIVVGNRVLQRENIDGFCQVAVADEEGDSEDLSGVKLRNSDRMTLPEIGARLHRRAEKVRKGQDKEIEQTKSVLDKIPPIVLPQLMRLVDILTYAVPFDLSKFGIRDDPFGSFMVTNCAPFDIKLGFAPLVPFARTPIVVLPGIIEDHAFVEDGEVVVRKGCEITFTADHRCFDGLQIGKIVRGMRGRLHHPRDYYPAPETYGSPETADGGETSPSATPPPEAARGKPVGGSGN